MVIRYPQVESDLEYFDSGDVIQFDTDKHAFFNDWAIFLGYEQHPLHYDLWFLARDNRDKKIIHEFGISVEKLIPQDGSLKIKERTAYANHIITRSDNPVLYDIRDLGLRKKGM